MSPSLENPCWQPPRRHSWVQNLPKNAWVCVGCEDMVTDEDVTDLTHADVALVRRLHGRCPGPSPERPA